MNPYQPRAYGAADCLPTQPSQESYSAADSEREALRALHSHLALCQDIMALTTRENQALAGSDAYEPFNFYQRRKDLLPRLEESLMSLSALRKRSQPGSPGARGGCPEMKSLSHAVQALLTRILLLDRENQQALLRRGLVPARHLPAAAVQRPHCVTDAYRRHSRA